MKIRQHRVGLGRNDIHRRSSVCALMLFFVLLPSTHAQVLDEIWGDDFEGFAHASCDSGLASSTTVAADFAAAIDLCKITTAGSGEWGLISATLRYPDGSGVPTAQSHAIRTAFGSNNSPRAGSAFVVLSTGTAADPSQAAPSYAPFEPGYVSGISSGTPADWLAAHGGTSPLGPGCPDAPNSTAYDPVMLSLQIRVPSNARSFTFSANFFSADFPEWVCGPYNDMFVALLDSLYAATPPNPSDKNIATWTSPGLLSYPLNVNLSRDNTGLFTQCVNGPTGCLSGNSGTISTCAGTSGLTNTGMDISDPAPAGCAADSQVGGATGWLAVGGNVVPGETITLRLALWDISDGYSDSLILLDNFRWSSQNIVPGIGLDN